MNTLYYINNNRKEPFTVEDLEKGRIIYEDDLIWHDKLDDWTKAKNILELEGFIRKKPPISLKKRLFNRLLSACLKGFILFFIFSLITGIIAGLIERNDYEKFFIEIKSNHDKNKKELDEKWEALQQEVLRLNGLIRKHEENVVRMTKLKGPPKTYDEMMEYGYGGINGARNLLKMKTISKEDFYANNDILRNNELYILKDGKIYSRWCTYVGDIYRNEDVSHNSCSKTFMRPYHAIFGDSNLSNEEQNSILVLLFNFSLASLLTHLPLLLVFVPVFYFRAKKHE